MQREEAIRRICRILAPTTENAVLQDDLLALTQGDWQQLNAVALQSGLNLLLYPHLKETGLQGMMPDSVRADMRERYLSATARNLKILHHAGIILRALREQQVDVIVLKGLYLAEAVYPNVGMRVFGDLDLLVRREDVDRGLAILQSLGYELSGYYDPQDPNREFKHLPPLVKEDAPPLELHWTIMAEDAPFDIHVEELWQKARLVRVAGVEVLALGTEDFILHLALHAAYQHGLRGGVRPLFDLAAVMQKEKDSIRWNELVQTASQWGIRRVLWLTLRLVAEMTGVAAPDEVIAELQGESEPLSMILEAREILFADESAVTLTPDLAALRNLTSPCAKIKRVMERVFLPRRTMARQYNVDPGSIRIYGYYMVRFWELLTRYGRTGLGLLQRDEVVLAQAAREEASVRLGEWLEKG